MTGPWYRPVETAGLDLGYFLLLLVIWAAAWSLLTIWLIGWHGFIARLRLEHQQRMARVHRATATTQQAKFPTSNVTASRQPVALAEPARFLVAPTWWTAPIGGFEVQLDPDGHARSTSTVLYADFGHPHARSLQAVTPPRDTT